MMSGRLAVALSVFATTLAFPGVVAAAEPTAPAEDGSAMVAPAEPGSSAAPPAAAPNDTTSTPTASAEAPPSSETPSPAPAPAVTPTPAPSATPAPATTPVPAPGAAAAGASPAPNGANPTKNGFPRPTLATQARPGAERGTGKPDVAADETFRIGPLLGIGFPRPLAVGGLVKIKRVVAVGGEYGGLRRMTIMGADTSFRAAAADLRVFPFRGSFFVGLRGGRQWLDASTTVTVGPVTTPEAMAASTWFVNPRLGFLHTFESGITVGIDAGVQLPINPTYTRTGLTTGVDPQLEQTLSSIAGALGNKVTPTVDLLRLGFLF